MGKQEEQHTSSAKARDIGKENKPTKENLITKANRKEKEKYTNANEAP